MHAVNHANTIWKPHTGETMSNFLGTGEPEKTQKKYPLMVQMEELAVDLSTWPQAVGSQGLPFSTLLLPPASRHTNGFTC